ncbi:hypothetical protein BDFB_013392 [Asbolus verrucosus]|uniref:Uncharacterized protein n=1 Tax=Asbolus verrucosus TaxID=1661398 RepID=A0A482WAP3_ASBVE|nr:hypothetical protein BDFB_013392 [Asbolus verrucosus]
MTISTTRARYRLSEVSLPLKKLRGDSQAMFTLISHSIACHVLYRMDNPSFGKDGEKTDKGIELSNTNGGASASENLVVTCTPEVCRAARQRYQPPDLAGSPWHMKKTVFLVGLIVLLIVWIIVFTTLSQLQLL